MPHQSREPALRVKWQEPWVSEHALRMSWVAWCASDGHHLQVPIRCRRRAPKYQVPLNITARVLNRKVSEGNIKKQKKISPQSSAPIQLATKLA